MVFASFMFPYAIVLTRKNALVERLNILVSAKCNPWLVKFSRTTHTYEHLHCTVTYIGLEPTGLQIVLTLFIIQIFLKSAYL